ncbi:hypothetical protein ACFVZR_07555 [Streptomyces sp. NPDC058316]|uniref:hypothetical protein n=1 Tax=Streptomyces sp. NPDC058316 TaxID=3346442 RepID=UPI0036E2A037
MTTDHKPENWFHEAGGDHCPHGAEPDLDSEARDIWADRHTGSPQDVYICLEAPAGEACGACSSEDGEMVPWAACRVREHARPKQGIVLNDAEHQQVTVWVGTEECLDRECEEYFTDDGDVDPGVERCSHVREETACSCQRGDDGEYGSEPCPALLAA